VTDDRTPQLFVERLSPIAFGVLVAVSASPLLFAAASGAAGFAGDLRLPALVLAGASLAALVECDRVRALVTRERVVVGFRHLRTGTLLRDLESVAVVESRPFDFVLALRRGPSWTFTVRKGRAVSMRRKGGFPVVFSCSNPEAFVEALRAAGAPASALPPKSEGSA
jgi:hypothetical protein